MLARLSAPLFLFCTVEGFAHTHDRKRYFLRIWAIATAMGTVEFYMMYAGVLRRGDGFYPLNAIMQNLVILCIIWQGIDWLRQRRFVRGALAAAMPILWPICIVALLMLFPKFRTHRSALPCWRGSSPRRCLCGHPSPMAAGLFWLGASCCMRCDCTSGCACGLGRCNIFVLSLASLFYLQARRILPSRRCLLPIMNGSASFAVVIMALYNGQRGSGAQTTVLLVLSRTSTFCTQHPVLSTRSHSEGFLWLTFWRSMMTATCVPY